MTVQSKIKPADGQTVRVRSRPLKTRVERALAEVTDMGLTAGNKTKRVSGRTHEQLFEKAAEVSGLDGNDLIEYALARVAMEDDWWETVQPLVGSISRDVDLEF